MKLYCQTDRMVLQVLSSHYYRQVLEFYMDNKAHLEPWEAKRDSQFYTTHYQKAMLDAEYNRMLRGQMIRYYMFCKEDPDQVIGCVCANDIRHGAFENCNIGYKVDVRFCRQGYGTEAVEKMLSVLFEEYGLHRIEAIVHPKNTGSVALLQKTGFQQEGVAREAAKLQGSWQDMLRFGKIKSDQ